MGEDDQLWTPSIRFIVVGSGQIRFAGFEKNFCQLELDCEDDLGGLRSLSRDPADTKNSSERSARINSFVLHNTPVFVINYRRLITRNRNK